MSLSEIVAEMRRLGVFEYHQDGMVVKLGPEPKAAVKKEDDKPAVNPAVGHMAMLSRSSSIKLWDK